MTTLRVGALVGVVALPAVLCVACVRPDSSGGVDPLGDPPAPRGSCFVAKYPRGWYGSGPLEVNGGQQVVVDSVALVDSNNLQLVGSYLLPDSSYIQSTEAPRKAEMDSGSPPTWHWSERQPAVGAVLDPNLPSYQLVVAAETEAPGEGTAKGIEVSYHDASGQFVRRDPFEIVMGSRRCD